MTAFCPPASAASLAPAIAYDHSEEESTGQLVDTDVSPTYRGHCRPGTGAASPKCHPATGATLSTMNRDSTVSGDSPAVNPLSFGGPSAVHLAAATL